MVCKIADLVTQIPEAGGLAPRCKDYLYKTSDNIEVVIRAEAYDPKKYQENISEDQLAYMESGRQFSIYLLEHDGFYLHSSAVEIDGRAYLFSGRSGEGKSTHTRLWQKHFGKKAKVFNDDKPALRCMDGIWYAYGTPWCGKDGININMKAPVAGICFLKQASKNRIRPLGKTEALAKVLPQTIHKFPNTKRLDLLLNHVDDLLNKVPVFELENKPEPEAAILSYETMRRAAEEMGR